MLGDELGDDLPVRLDNLRPHARHADGRGDAAFDLTLASIDDFVRVDLAMAVVHQGGDQMAAAAGECELASERGIAVVDERQTQDSLLV